MWFKKVVTLPVVFAGLALASSGVIVILATNTIAFPSGGAYFPFEPSTATSGSAHAVAWNEVTNITSTGSKVSTFSTGFWHTPILVTNPNGQTMGDFNLAWDNARGRFVFAALAVNSPLGSSIWYGYSTDSVGTSWTTATQVMPGTSGVTWDYPSIAVDAGGRIIVGAVEFSSTNSPLGYYASVSTNGVTFPTPSRVSTFAGPASRVVATTQFLAFGPTLNAGGLPTAVSLSSSSDGVTWSSPTTLATFMAPLNQSPTSPSYGRIFYAPLLQAQGYASGLWTVAFPINNGGYNNIDICTSDRGCGLANAAADDEFLQGTSVAGDGNYWLNYYTFSTLTNRQLPLVTQAIYYPFGNPGIGKTIDINIQPPVAWVLFGAGDRCTQSCYAAGDFNNIAHTAAGMAITPFISQVGIASAPALNHNFLQDPQAPVTASDFKPNFIPHVIGADLSSLGIEGPPETAVGIVGPRHTWKQSSQ